MRANPGPLPVVALLVTLGLPAALAADPKPSVRWQLDQLASIGGQAPTVWGSPKIVPDPAGSWLHFNGSTDGLIVPGNPLAGCAEFTIEVLVYPDSDGPKEQRFLHLQDDRGNRVLMETRVSPQGWALDTFLYSVDQNSRKPLLDETKRHAAERWTWVALVYARGHMAHFINGAKELEGDVSFSPMTGGQLSLGVRQNKVHWYKGGIREVRFHPTALSATELQQTP